MSVSVDEVRLWAIGHDGQIGHAVAWTGLWGASYVHTACGSLGNFATTKTKPKRICRACRAQLKLAHHIGEAK